MDRQQANDFAKALLGPGFAAPAISSRNERDRDRRFNIYRNNVVSSLIDALAATFPVVLALVGEEFFRAMAGIHVVASPPRSRILASYGADFPDFLASFEPAAGLPYLADVARLEWLRVQCYHAADAEALGATDFQPLLADPERLLSLHIGLHPACRWFRSKFAACSVWAAHQNDTPDLSSIDLLAPEEVLIVRPRWDVRVVALPPGGAAWLSALAAGQSLAAAISNVANDFPDCDVSRLLAVLIEHGLAIGLTHTPGDSP